jgi:integrase/recombinase XerD
LIAAQRYLLPESAGARGIMRVFISSGITAYLENGGTLEKTQQIAAHKSARTTKLYDRTSGTITLDEIEKIAI